MYVKIKPFEKEKEWSNRTQNYQNALLCCYPGASVKCFTTCDNENEVFVKMGKDANNEIIKGVVLSIYNICNAVDHNKLNIH